MGIAGKVYTAEFKQQVVALTQQPEMKVKGVVRDLGISRVELGLGQ